MNAVDYVAVTVLVLGALNGLRRGVSGELAATISTVLALLFGLVCYHPFGTFVAGHTIVSAREARALTFIAVVISATIVLLAVRITVRSVVRLVVSSRKLDRAGGVFLGATKGCVTVAIVILAVSLWPHPYLNRVFTEESVLGSTLAQWLPELRERAEAILEERGD